MSDGFAGTFFKRSYLTLMTDDINPRVFPLYANSSKEIQRAQSKPKRKRDDVGREREREEGRRTRGPQI